MPSPFDGFQIDGDQGRIAPDGWTPPDGDYALCLGHDKEGVFQFFNPSDSIEWTQNADFNATGIATFRARTRGSTNMPHVVNVTAAATQTYTITIDGTDFEYIADTAGLPISGQTGSAASLDVLDGAGLLTVTGLTGMTEESVGRMIEITGAASGANNGTFPIREFIDATSVKYENASGVVPDGNNGSISWTERRLPDTVNTIASALRDVINATATIVTARTHTDGVIAIWTVDPDDEPTYAVGASLSDGDLTWIATMEIDGSIYFSQPITHDRTRERYDGGGCIIGLAPGNHDLTFKLELTGSVSGPIELELPAFYVDQIIFTDHP